MVICQNAVVFILLFISFGNMFYHVTFFERDITFFRRLILITSFTLIPVQLKLMMLVNVSSNPKLARYGVKFFLILENTDSSSTLLWMMHNITLASLKRLSNLLLFYLWKDNTIEHQYGRLYCYHLHQCGSLLPLKHHSTNHLM